MPKANIGKAIKLGIALQSAVGTAVAPTLFVKRTGGSEITIDRVWAREDYADGSTFVNASEQGGITHQGKNAEMHFTADALDLLLDSICNGGTAYTAVTVTIGATPVAQNDLQMVVTTLSAAVPNGAVLTFNNGVTVITRAEALAGATNVLILAAPAAIASGATASSVAGTLYVPRALDNAFALAPGKPLTLELQAPEGGLLVRDAQVRSIAWQTPGREAPYNLNVGYDAVYVAELADGDYTAGVTTTVPAFTRRDAQWFNGGKPQSTETSSVNFAIGMTAVDGENGTDFIDGFERNEKQDLNGSYTIGIVDLALRAQYNTHTRSRLTCVLKRGARMVRLNVFNAEITTFTRPAGLDRLTASANWQAVSLAGEAPFSVFVALT